VNNKTITTRKKKHNLISISEDLLLHVNPSPSNSYPAWQLQW